MRFLAVSTLHAKHASEFCCKRTSLLLFEQLVFKIEFLLKSYCRLTARMVSSVRQDKNTQTHNSIQGKIQLLNNFIDFVFCTQKSYPATATALVQAPRMFRLVDVSRLCFVLESVQESIIYPQNTIKNEQCLKASEEFTNLKFSGFPYSQFNTYLPMFSSLCCKTMDRHEIGWISFSDHWMLPYPVISHL